MTLPAHAEDGKRDTHPLLPGIRCPDVWNTDWPRTLHDKQLTGFSPLPLGMKSAPRVWATVETGGELGWVRQIQDAAGLAASRRVGRGLDAAGTALLVNDGRLRLVALDGTVRWTSPAADPLIFAGDLRGSGHPYLLLGGGPRLTLLDAETGKVEWQTQFEPPHLQVRAQVADILPDRPGLEAAVFFAYGEEGLLLHFPPAGEPEVVWRRTVVVPGEHPERADHGCAIRLDLTVPDKPLIWNVRHHRCRGYDARTGETISSLVYPIGGGHRRNYGPWAFGKGKGGRPLICVAGEAIQLHVHAIRLNRDGPSTIAWEHYYGEVYEQPGVAVKSIAMEDVDGDGETEMVYNVRDPAQGFRSFVRVRDADTGEVEVELADRWCVGAFSGLGAEGASGLLVLPAPDGATPDQGSVFVLRFTGPGKLAEVAVLKRAQRWGPITLPGAQGSDLLVRQDSPKGRAELARYALRGGRLECAARERAGALLHAPLHLALPSPETFLVSTDRGRLQGVTVHHAAGVATAAPSSRYRQGRRRWEIPLEGGPSPNLSAADTNGDGQAELFALAAGGRVRRFAFGKRGGARETASFPFTGSRDRHSPLLYDLEGTGRLCLIAPGSTPEGKVAVRAYRPDGRLLWETALDVSTADRGQAVAWNAGQFLPGPRAAVAVSVGNAQRTVEGTYLLEGRTGRVLWFKDRYHDGDAIRGFVPVGIPSAFDADGDSVEDIGMDLYSYLAYLRGADGSFAFVRHTANIRAEGALYAGMLYNSFCPLYRAPEDTRPHWLSALGYGSLGLNDPDPSTGRWVEELGYDMPGKAGLVDVDGDGVLECGYSPANSTFFRCRNVWTGEMKWELKLPGPVYGPTLAADVDGDGKGEFLVGRYCIGTDARGQGEIRWEAPVPLGWAVVADFDGDGKGEIACPGRGKVTILK